MAYIGNIPAESYASFERQVFTIVNSQTAYTLSHSVVNENDIRLVVNNVVQEPGSGKAYTASGTTLTLSAALVNGTDEMYCVFLGRALQTVNPPNASVGTTQLADSSVTSAKLSGVTQGITSASQYRITANKTGNADVTSSYEVVATDGYGGIGTAPTESSGIFTFPSTGIYLILVQAYIFLSSDGDTSASLELKTTTDNSSYDVATRANVGYGGSGSTPNQNGYGQFIFDVTSTSTHKCKLTTSGFNTSGSTQTTLYGQTGENVTSITFLRLGDT